MRTRTHLRMFASGAAVWGAFWLAGLPSYYQQYSFPFLLVGTTLLVPPSAWIGWGILRRSKLERRKPLAFWLAFYFTVPFAAFDALYCGAWLGHGAGYLATYWYLTVFYFIPWILYLPMGWWLTRAQQ